MPNAPKHFDSSMTLFSSMPLYGRDAHHFQAKTNFNLVTIGKNRFQKIPNGSIHLKQVGLFQSGQLNQMRTSGHFTDLEGRFDSVSRPKTAICSSSSRRASHC